MLAHAAGCDARRQSLLHCMLAYADVCWRMLAHAAGLRRATAKSSALTKSVRARMLTYAHVCGRMRQFATRVGKVFCAAQIRTTPGCETSGQKKFKKKGKKMCRLAVKHHVLTHHK
jgi:hypothetical protein